VDIALLCFLANLIAHSDRVSISVAMPVLMREHGWDTAQAGWVLSGFFLGYTLLMVPVGMLAQRYGPKPVFAACMSWWSVCTLLTPLPRSLGGLTALRILLGVGESGTASCINGTLVRWFPRHEYARATALCWSAGYAGPVLAVPAATYLLHLWGWRSIFYVFGLAGFLWLPWWLRAERGPELPALTSEPVPWGTILRSPSIRALFVLHFSSNWFLYFMISWLPTYLASERQLSLPQMAAGSSLPFLCAWIGANLFAQLLDKAGEGAGRSRACKLLLIPYSVSALCLLAASAASSAVAAVALLCGAMALLGSITPVFASGSLDLTPRHAAAVASAQNTFANLAGILAPVVIGYLVKAAGWPAAFTVTAFVVAVGVGCYAWRGDRDRILCT
jgi:MFS family permease